MNLPCGLSSLAPMDPPCGFPSPVPLDTVPLRSSVTMMFADAFLKAFTISVACGPVRSTSLRFPAAFGRSEGLKI